MTQGPAGSAPAAGRVILDLRRISKGFAGVQALRQVDLSLRAGEVHALLGENGAGKSTLMKVMFGVEQPDSGEIVLEGSQPLRVTNPRHALSLGIGLVSQELSLVPQLSAAENIFLGQTGPLSLVARGRRSAASREILARLAPGLPVDTPVGSLGMAERQVVEIARTLARGGRVIAFDEPTSSLTTAEQERLFSLIRDLKGSGKAIVYISHRMAEIFAIADRITVLRDGSVVATGAPSDFTTGELNSLIAGRTLAEALHQPHGDAQQDDRPVVLAASNLVTPKLRDVSFTLRKGEILGLAGLVGSGRTELLRAVFGADPLASGSIFVEGKAIPLSGPADAMKAGLALIPEDRRGQATIPVMDVERNFGLASYGRFSAMGIIRGGLRRAEARKAVDELAVRPRGIGAAIRSLSGGNQQKVIIARWLASGARIFLFDEPTRGIDVGAKSEIHALIRRLAAQGASVLVVSSELPELLMLSDRLAIMHEGRLSGVINNGPGLTEERLLRYASGEMTP